MGAYRNEFGVIPAAAAASGASTPTSSSEDILGEYGLVLDDGPDPGATEQVSVVDEYSSYALSPPSKSGQDILQFWTVRSIDVSKTILKYILIILKVNEEMYPTLFKIALDYLPIQASAVPCERVFSSSAETDTKRRNRIKPILMEALQIIKYRKKKERLNLMSDWAETVEKVHLDEEMKGEIDGPGETSPTSDILADLLENRSEDGMKAALSAIEQEDEMWDVV